MTSALYPPTESQYIHFQGHFGQIDSSQIVLNLFNRSAGPVYMREPIIFITVITDILGRDEMAAITQATFSIASFINKDASISIEI